MLENLPKEYFDENDSDNRCFLCNNPKYKVTQQVDHFEFPFTFQECQCGIEKQTPMPNEKFFEWFFNSNTFFDKSTTDKKEIWGYHDYFADEPSRLATSAHRYKVLRPFLEEKKPLSILKIGPATGTMLHMCKKNGHHVLGVDVSERFANYARENYDLEIKQGRFERMDFEKHQFDVIFLFNVVENVPNQTEFFNALNKFIKPGGLFISNYVDMTNNYVAKIQKSKYFLYRPPICYSYTSSVYKRVLGKFGFEIEKVMRDKRTMSVEKILTLMRWKYLYRFSKFLHINKWMISLYAYPSKIVVARKSKEVQEPIV